MNRRQFFRDSASFEDAQFEVESERLEAMMAKVAAEAAEEIEKEEDDETLSD